MPKTWKDLAQAAYKKQLAPKDPARLKRERSLGVWGQDDVGPKDKASA